MTTESRRVKSASAIIWSRLLTHSGDQAWDFAVPLALVAIFPAEIDLVALYYLVVRFTHMILVTRVCSAMDRMNRLAAIRVGIAAQTVGVSLAVAAIHALAATERAEGLSAPFVLVPYLLTIVGGLIGSLGATMMEIAVSQDWLPIVIPPADLARVNGRVKQVDLGTELGAPVVAGLLLAVRPDALPLLGLYVIAAWNLVSFLPEYLLLRGVYRAEAALSERPPVVSVARRSTIFENLTAGWRDFFRQPAALAMVSYALLWLTVISPHGVLLAAWLKGEWGLPEAAIGAFRGLGAVFGLLATLAFPWALKHLSLVAATRAFVLWEALCLVGAGVAFYLGRDFALLFAGLVLLSRMGLYGFSLGETEIRQRTIPRAVRGRVNGFASALTSLATLGVYGAGTLLNEPPDFAILIYGSIGCVLLGTGLFTMWSLARGAQEVSNALKSTV